MEKIGSRNLWSENGWSHQEDGAVGAIGGGLSEENYNWLEEAPIFELKRSFQA